jgi:hypothetical protein
MNGSCQDPRATCIHPRNVRKAATAAATGIAARGARNRPGTDGAVTAIMTTRSAPGTPAGGQDRHAARARRRPRPAGPGRPGGAGRQREQDPVGVGEARVDRRGRERQDPRRPVGEPQVLAILGQPVDRDQPDQQGRIAGDQPPQERVGRGQDPDAHDPRQQRVEDEVAVVGRAPRGRRLVAVVRDAQIPVGVPATQQRQRARDAVVRGHGRPAPSR